MESAKLFESIPDNVCRDFMRNVCSRGMSCKYFHPLAVENNRKLIFCHDFQNGNCFRLDCRFIHCSLEDEEYYKQNGYLPPKLEPDGGEIAFDKIPICKGYTKGDCHRSQMHCKFRHVNQKLEFPYGSPNVPSNAPNPLVPPNGYEFHKRYDFTEDFSSKRKCVEFNGTPLTDRQPVPILKIPIPQSSWIGPLQQQPYWQLKNELEILRKQVTDLETRNKELESANELLVQKNTLLKIINDQEPLSNTQQVLNAIRTATTVPVSLVTTSAGVLPVSNVSMAPTQTPPSTTESSSQRVSQFTISRPLVSYPVVRSMLTNTTSNC